LAVVHERAPPMTKIDQEERKGKYHAKVGTQTSDAKNVVLLEILG